MKKAVVRDYYVLPCCLLVLNLCVELAQYKVKGLGDPLIATAVIMGVALFGGSLMAFVVAPALSWVIATMHHSSRRTAGTIGEILFLIVLGVAIYWLYYRVYMIGPQSILPVVWRNH